jgi:hypothetical protein
MNSLHGRKDAQFLFFLLPVCAGATLAQRNFNHQEKPESQLGGVDEGVDGRISNVGRSLSS